VRSLDAPIIPRLARGVWEFLLLALIAVAAWYLWPTSLGGGTQMIAVRGQSMEPTYDHGDLLVVRADAAPALGDVIVFRIPDDEPGGGNLVVHRFVGVRDDGTMITQGDNRDTPDSFRVTQDDVVGSPRFVVPFAARIVDWVSTATGLAVVGGLLVTLLLWPDRMRRRIVVPASWRPRTEPRSADELAPFMADAEAWVERELAAIRALPERQPSVTAR